MDIVIGKPIIDHILCLTKAQLGANNDTSIAESASTRQYTMHLNTNVNICKSIACGYSNEITISSNKMMTFLFLL